MRKEKSKSVMGYAIAGIVLISMIAILAVFGGTIMKAFGFEGNSAVSVIIFFVIVAIVGFPIEVFAQILPVSLVSFNKISAWQAKILFIVLDTIVTCIIMGIIDYFMASVTATDTAIFVIAFVMAILSLKEFSQTLSRELVS